MIASEEQSAALQTTPRLSVLVTLHSVIHSFIVSRVMFPPLVIVIVLVLSVMFFK